MAIDPSQLTPDQMNALGWLTGAQWGGSSPYGIAAATDPNGPLAARDVDAELSSSLLAKKMRRQSTAVPPVDGDTPDDNSVFATGTTSFGSLSPWQPSQPSQFATSNGPISAGPASAPVVSATAAQQAPPLPPAQTIKRAPTPIDMSDALPAAATPTSGTSQPIFGSEGKSSQRSLGHGTRTRCLSEPVRAACGPAC